MDSKASSSAPDVSQPAILASAKNTVDAVKDNVQNVKEKAMDSMQNVVSNATATKASMIVTGLVVGFAVASLVGLALYWMLTRGVVKKQIFTLAKTPLPGYEVSTLSTEGIPAMRNEMSISFWMYVNDIPQFKNPVAGRTDKLIRHIWHMGQKIPDPTRVGPLVTMVSMKPNNSPQQNYLLVSFQKKTPTAVTSYNTDNALLAAHERGFIFNYIPIKRWVNVTVTVNITSNAITGYLDGERVPGADKNAVLGVASLTPPDMAAMKDNVELTTVGDVYIGGRASDPVGIGFAGLVSNIKIFNYVMEKTEVYSEYKRGPIDNIFAKMGLPAYGVRPPVYKIGDTE